MGPYEVLERADKFFWLAVGGHEETVSIDRLKLHLGAGPFSVVLPVARGCPLFSAPVVFQLQRLPDSLSRGSFFIGIGPQSI